MPTGIWFVVLHHLDSSVKSGNSEKETKTWRYQFLQVFVFLHDVVLLRTLLQVTISAKHLAVIWNCLSTFAPRHNVISVHLFKLIFFTANGTFMPLFLISSQCITAIKGTNRQFLFFACQQIFIDT